MQQKFEEMKLNVATILPMEKTSQKPDGKRVMWDDSKWERFAIQKRVKNYKGELQTKTIFRYRLKKVTSPDS